MDLISGLGAINTAISIGKAVIQADSAYDQATLKSQLADMMSELANAKIAQIEMIEQNRKLNDEVDRLLRAEGDITALKEDDGYYYNPDEAGNPMGWPACPSCLTKEKQITLLVQKGAVDAAQCPRCGTDFNPVTSFVAPGTTRQAEKLRRSSEAMDRMNRSFNSGPRDWMGR